MGIFFAIVAPSTVIVCCYLWRRTKQVFNFRKYCLELCKQYDSRYINIEQKSSYFWFYEKLPSFSKMVISIKPLKLQNWTTKEIIDKLQSHA
jgi:hypothetical protein